MPSDREPILGLESATLGYPGRVVLSGVSLDVAKGEFWFLLGPNGSGKTTILRVLLELIEPLAGSVWRHPVHAARARLGFVPQYSTLSPALPTTLREFVSLGTIGGDRARSRLGEDLAWALDRTRLAGLEGQDYWSLSGGQRKRALVARALVRRPSVILLDEATEGMDLRAEDEFMETLARLHREEGSTVLFVTHRVEVAARHATHVALIHEGRVVQGRARDVLQSDLLAAAFGPRGEALAARLAGEARSTA
jgi:zinc transport system ATP-binding protein